MRELSVWSNQALVGHLREGDDIWRFEYSPEWLSLPNSFALSPALPLQAGEQVDGSSIRSIQWYFDNLLPEEGLREVLAKEADLPAADAFGLLAHFGAESAGSLVLMHGSERIEGTQGLKPLTATALSERIRNLPTASLTKDSPKKMSLAGAQHKMLVVLKDGEMFEPLPGTPSTHILKPAHLSPEYPASVINEYFVMRLAAAVGLRAVPKVYRMYVPEPVYLVERFDRTENAEGSVKRLHAIDTCQLLNKSRIFKYKQANLETLQEALGHCREKAADRIELFKWLVFNVLVGNSDNHLKNISFLVSHEGIGLAPAYDMLSTSAYDTQAYANNKPATWPQTELALSLGGALRFSQANKAAMIDVGVAMGLSAKIAERHFDILVSALAPAADKLIAEIEAENEARSREIFRAGDAAHYLAAELRLLRTIRFGIITDMLAVCH